MTGHILSVPFDFTCSSTSLRQSESITCQLSVANSETVFASPLLVYLQFVFHHPKSFLELRLVQFRPAWHFITGKNWTHGDLSSVPCSQHKVMTYFPSLKLGLLFPAASCLKSCGFTINISITISIRANHGAPLWSCMLIWALMNLIFVWFCCQLHDCIDRLNMLCNSVGDISWLACQTFMGRNVLISSWVETLAQTGRG